MRIALKIARLLNLTAILVIGMASPFILIVSVMDPDTEINRDTRFTLLILLVTILYVVALIRALKRWDNMPRTSALLLAFCGSVAGILALAAPDMAAMLMGVPGALFGFFVEPSDHVLIFVSLYCLVFVAVPFVSAILFMNQAIRLTRKNRTQCSVP